MPGRVGVEFGVRGRTPAAALVEQHHVITLGIEQAPMIGRTAAARAAMEEDRGLPPRRAASFPIDLMAVADIEMTGRIGLDRRNTGAGARQASSNVRNVARDTTPASCASLIISWIAPAISLR